jgi:sulfur-oxidizing protein SoxX
MTASEAAANDRVAPDNVVVIGDRIPARLVGLAGSAEAGRRIVLDRETGNCLICHRVPEPAERFQGNLGPDLTGIGRRLDADQLRLRLVDQSRLNPETIMPPYYRTSGLVRVSPTRAGSPALSAEQIEHVVAYLAGLTE